MPPKRSRRPVLSTTSPPPEIDQPSKRQKKGSQSQSLSIDYDLLADAILKKQNQFNPNSSIVHHNVAPPDTEEISTSSVVPSGNACQQNQPSAALSQIDSIPASQTVSLHVSPDPNQQPCPQPSLEPDTLSVPAVLNSLFGGSANSCTMAEQNTSANSSQPTSHLSTTALALLRSSLSESTTASYKRSWMLFQQFCLQGNVSNQLPISEITLCNFIAHLFAQNYSPSSIASMVSAISYVHQIFNILDHSQ